MLSPREEQVLQQLARGASTKVIASELGVSLSTVSVYIERARLKVGARSRIDMIRLHRTGRRLPASLSPVERAIVEGVLDGKTNAEIAAERQRALGTIAKQLSSAFRKLGVCSRCELAVRIYATDTATRCVDT